MFFGSKKRAVKAEDPVAPPIFNGKPPTAASAASQIAVPPAGASMEQKAQPAAVARQATAFAQIVALLMRSPAHKHHTIADLEWLVFAPLLSGQFDVAEARNQGDSTRVQMLERIIAVHVLYRDLFPLGVQMATITRQQAEAFRTSPVTERAISDFFDQLRPIRRAMDDVVAAEGPIMAGER